MAEQDGVQRLDENLLLRSVQDARDIDRFARFNETVNGADQGATCAALLRGHPRVRPQDFWMVEDEQRGDIVSTTCLIPWHLQLEGVRLRVAMLEMVVTHPDYRGQGLVRAQIDHFHRTVAEQGYDLAIIEGIPYFYRRFGYGYVHDHWAADLLPAARIPDVGPGPAVELRAATSADVPDLQRLYDETMAAHTLWVERDAATWRYLLETARYPVFLVDSADAQALGYVVVWRIEQDIVIMESAVPAAVTAHALLRRLQPLADGLRIGYAAQSTLTRLARSLGAQPFLHDQWLVRVPDLPRLLLKLGPVFARRLAASAWAGYSGDFVLNLYHAAYCLRFTGGNLTQVEALGFVDASMGADPGEVAAPPDAWLRLLLGYRSVEEVRDAWPDLFVQPSHRDLIDTLFPKFYAHVWMPYMHCGDLTPL